MPDLDLDQAKSQLEALQAKLPTQEPAEPGAEPSMAAALPNVDWATIAQIVAMLETFYELLRKLRS